MKNQEHQLALLVACAAVLQIGESLIPHPVPGIRLGLANMIALVALFRWGLARAMEITLFRTVVSALVMGTLFAPPFLLSLAGGVLSTLVMAALLAGLRQRPHPLIGLAGVSMAGALMHNLTQLVLVYLLLIPHASLFLLLPWLALGAVLAGWVNGLVANRVLIRMEAPEQLPLSIKEVIPDERFESRQFSCRRGWLHRLSPHVKIAGLWALGLIIVLVAQGALYAGLISILFFMMVTARLSIKSWWLRIWRLKPILLFALLLPALIHNGANSVTLIAPLSLSIPGLHQGALYLLRLVILLTGTLLLTASTSPDRLIASLKVWMRPLRFLGLDPEHGASILVGAWALLPILWGHLRQMMRDLNHPNQSIRSRLDHLSVIIAWVYLESESDTSPFISTGRTLS